MSEDYSWDMETGEPERGLLSNAIQVWAILQKREVSIADAAKAFNIEPSRAYDAVVYHPYMLVAEMTDDFSQMIIVHDGE